MSELLQQLQSWEHLPFLVALCLGALLVLVQFVGFGLHELLGGDAELDAGHDLDGEVGLELQAGVGVELDPDAAVELGVQGGGAELDTEGLPALPTHGPAGGVDLDLPGGELDHQLDHHVPGAHAPAAGWLHAVLAWLNVGRAPLVVVLQQLLLHVGLWGVGALWVLRRTQELSGGRALLLAGPFALAAGAFTTKAVTGLVARLLPVQSGKQVTRRSLVGARARVSSAALDERGGRATVRDAQGDLYTVFCRLSPGLGPVPRGGEVELVAYEPERDRYLARPLGAGPGPPAPAGGAGP